MDGVCEKTWILQSSEDDLVCHSKWWLSPWIEAKGQLTRRHSFTQYATTIKSGSGMVVSQLGSSQCILCVCICICILFGWGDDEKVVWVVDVLICHLQKLTMYRNALLDHHRLEGWWRKQQTLALSFMFVYVGEGSWQFWKGLVPYSPMSQQLMHGMTTTSLQKIVEDYEGLEMIKPAYAILCIKHLCKWMMTLSLIVKTMSSSFLVQSRQQQLDLRGCLEKQIFVCWCAAKCNHGGLTPNGIKH